MRSISLRAAAVTTGLLIFVIVLSGGITHHVRPDLIPNHVAEWKQSLSFGNPQNEPEPEIPVQPFQEEIFPLARDGKLPKINQLNVAKNNKLKTPIFIGFTRNWYLLEQAVVSYITAGWPASEIIVIDNSGVMDSNLRGLLSPENPWYLNHTRLDQLGVSVKRTPTLLTFAQLQNFFINYAVEQDWSYFFWSHMDVIVLSKEHEEPYRPFYGNVLDCLQGALAEPVSKWALKFFAYDWMTLVNVDAMKAVGGWDTQIPYYMTDCDMYSRLSQHNYTKLDCRAGDVYDVASFLIDLSVLYPNPKDGDTLNTERFKILKDELEKMMDQKQKNKKGRNTWQARQAGGRGEPFWKHPEGFETAINYWIAKGRELFQLKWGTSECDLEGLGYKGDEEWRGLDPKFR